MEIEIPKHPKITPPQETPFRQNVPQTWVSEGEAVGFHQGPQSRRRGAKLIIWSWVAAMIDACVLSGLCLIFLAVFLFIVKSSWGSFGGQGREFTLFSCAAIFSTLTFFYMIMLRSFLGFTLGDWACGLRLGSAFQRQSQFYTLRVFIRSSILFCTGILILPLVSLLFRQDLAGKISGISLISLK